MLGGYALQEGFTQKSEFEKPCVQLDADKDSPPDEFLCFRNILNTINETKDA